MKIKYFLFFKIFLLSLFVTAQEKTITGTVSDQNNIPLPGASVVVKGTATGTQTDFDGNFAIQAKSGDVLVFSYIGQKTEERGVGATNIINVMLAEDAQALDEVVVTALGIKRKKDEITTANQVVETEELVKANNPDVVQGLSGKVTGLTIKTTSNGVSGDKQILLRGSRSISGNNQALIVIDGAISSANFLQSIDPNSIESVNVIKGANGAALYGSQGINGAIIVTTKKGTRTEGVVVQFNSSAEFENVAYVPEKQTRYGQGWSLGDGFENVIYENGSWGPEFDGRITEVGLPQADGTFITAPYSSRGADHIKEFFSQGTTLQNSASLSAGSADNYVYFSAQNQNTEFIIKNDELNKSTFNFKGGRTLGKWNLQGNATYSYSSYQQANPSSTIYGDLLQTAANIPIKEFENSGNEGHWNAYYDNPYFIRDTFRNEQQSNRFNLLADINYTINENVNITLRSNGLFFLGNNLSYNGSYTEPQSVIDRTGADRSFASAFQESLSYSSTYYTDLIANFDYVLTDDVTLKANLGFNNQYFKSNFSRVGGTGLTVPGLYNGDNLSSGFDDSITGNSKISSRRLGVFGQLDFGFYNFLFLNVTGRLDQTSVLPKENDTFFYPSVGLSFIPTKAIEGLRNSSILNDAKFTASYVRVGKDDGVAAYGINNIYAGAPGFPFGGQNSFVTPNNITDPNIEPEFNTSYEFGMNLGFLRNRITLDAAYANFTTENLITSVAAAPSSGLTRSTINVGELKGYSVEVDLGVTPFKSENFQWDLRAGFSKNYTEIVKVSDQTDEVSLGGFTGLAEVFAVEGEQFPSVKVSAYERDPQGRVVIDANTGNPIESSELKIGGTATPDYVLNFNTSFRYKNFTLSATADYRTGHVFWSQARNSNIFSGYLIESAQGGRGAFIYPNSSINTGTAENPVYVENTNVPSATGGSGAYINFWTRSSNVGENSLLDASAFKLREVTFRYDLDRKFLEGTFIKGASFSVYGRNLLTLLPAENRGYNDPESNFTTGNAQGVSSVGQFPPTSSAGLSVNLTF